MANSTSFGFADARGDRSPGLHDLMREQVRDVLFVSSLYESFIMAEDGQLDELVVSKFLDLNLSRAPNISRVSSGEEALALVRTRHRFDLIITSLQVGEMNAVELARKVRAAGLNTPVILLAYDHRALTEFLAQHDDVSELERVFVWQGDARILLAIVKFVEDRRNVVLDTKVGVPVLLVVEDSVRYYSSFLPVIYAEVMKLSQSLFSEGVNLYHRLQRMRARPKILHCVNFEEAWSYFFAFKENVLGVITDMEFPRDGELHEEAGLDFARMVRAERPDLPIALQSSHPENEKRAGSVGAGFFLKGSPVMLQQLRQYLTEHFYFGDFVFRLPDGTEIDRAEDLKTLAEKLHTVPAESIAHHGARNDFSGWLRARAEFDLAFKLRPRKVTDFESLEALREELIRSIDEYRRERDRSAVADFDAVAFDDAGGITRIGGGSLGGKGRGLAFASRLLDRHEMGDRYPGVRITVPHAAVLGTDVFDAFLDGNELREDALQVEDESELEDRFIAGVLPDDAREELAAFLEVVDSPLAVRSSSLLEDSPYQSFAGIFETWMLPNDHPDPDVRLEQLVAAVKRVYASTFSGRTKAFLRATPYRLEEEQMAVVIQKVAGARRGSLYYPDISGVARSYNFYPTPPATSEDGIAAVALGFGKTVVEGGACYRFSPTHPKHNLEFSTPEEVLRGTQREFWALRLGGHGDEPVWRSGGALIRCPLEVAEADGSLSWVGARYSEADRAIHDGLARPGVPVVNFSPILKHELFPLAPILRDLLEIGAEGTGSPVEIEFAATLSTPPGEPRELAFLQLRPLALTGEFEEVEIGDPEPGDLICESPSALGNVRIDGIHDVVMVDRDRFDRLRSDRAARIVARFNADLAAEERPYILIGVGRWGSSHPSLGIPVRWEEIAGARAIVEAGFRDFRVAPSQGTHFFQNLVSFNVGYFTVNARLGEGFVAWEWLSSRPETRRRECVRHLRFDEPIVVAVDGRSHRGIIGKPGFDPETGNGGPANGLRGPGG